MQADRLAGTPSSVDEAFRTAIRDVMEHGEIVDSASAAKRWHELIGYQTGMTALPALDGPAGISVIRFRHSYS